MSTQFESLLGDVRVVPVITVPEIEHAVALAEALVAGGLPVLEITLRTPAGLPAIKRISDEVPGAIVGAGTVTNADQFHAVRDAGAQFVVSPGCTDSLAQAHKQAGGVFLPGAVTASEVLQLLEHGITVMKFFPAETSGGIAAIKALGGPFPDIRFCPTGGIGLELAPRYLEQPNVVCIGGSWMVPNALVVAEDWAAIRELAADASAATRRPTAVAV